MTQFGALRARNRYAFTLIELLVVVAILTLLISILVPALSEARRQAKGVVCLSNMRSLMTAVYVYTNDSNGRFPGAGLTHGGQDDDIEESWVRQLARDFGNDMEIVRCPLDQSEFWERPLGDGRLRQTSFASNAYTVYPIGERDPYDRIGLITRPASTIYWVELAEKGEFAAADHVHPENWWFGDPPAELAEREMQIHRHKGRADYAFLDGHVDRLQFEDTFKLDPESREIPPGFFKNKYDPAIGR